jgi:hypothetical protein
VRADGVRDYIANSVPVVIKYSVGTVGLLGHPELASSLSNGLDFLNRIRIFLVCHRCQPVDCKAAIVRDASTEIVQPAKNRLRIVRTAVGRLTQSCD